jgi:hypothetical protein
VGQNRVTSLSLLEKAVLQATGEQLSPEDQRALQMQIASATVRSRENTGAGFFTYFEGTREPAHKVQTDPKGCNVAAKIPDLRYGLGFILWLTDGYMDNLEGYTFGESTVGINLDTIRFELVSGLPFSN